MNINLVTLEGEELQISITNLDDDPLFEILKFAILYRIDDLALIEMIRRRVTREIGRMKGLYKTKQ